MYSVGGAHPKKPPQKKAEAATKKSAALEMGILAEAEVKPLTIED